MPDPVEDEIAAAPSVQTGADEAPAPKDWEPQALDAETGVYMTGEYPTNHRLRAEALVKARRKSDPNGVISDELIADTAARVRAEREAE